MLQSEEFDSLVVPPMFAETAAFSSSPVRPPPRRALLEQARLAAVRACRRSAPTHPNSLDRIAEAAARACGARIGAVCLVGEDTLEFAGLFGLAVRDTARRLSLCEDVVATEAPLLVKDAQQMPAFCDHELVRSGVVRAYAGVPLIDADGYVVGTVCVMSPEAGALDAVPLDDLAALACFSETLLSFAIEAPGASGRGWLGVKTKRAHRLDSGRPGAIVLRVARQSPAERAGLKPADVLHSIDECVLRGPDDLSAALNGRAPGESAVVRFQRRGEWLACRVVLARSAPMTFSSAVSARG